MAGSNHSSRTQIFHVTVSPNFSILIYFGWKNILKFVLLTFEDAVNNLNQKFLEELLIQTIDGILKGEKDELNFNIAKSLDNLI